jgi:WD40 repeat protein
MNCDVCLNIFNTDMKKPILINCGHTFCYTCVNMVNSCPICRKKISQQTVNFKILDFESNLKKEYFLYRKQILLNFDKTCPELQTLNRPEFQQKLDSSLSLSVLDYSKLPSTSATSCTPSTSSASSTPKTPSTSKFFLKHNSFIVIENLNKKKLIISFNDSTLNVWTETGFRQIHTEQQDSEKCQVSKSNDKFVKIIDLGSGLVASISFNNIIRVWDMNQFCLKFNLIGHNNNVRYVFRNSFNKLISISNDKQTIIWNLLTGLMESFSFNEISMGGLVLYTGITYKISSLNLNHLNLKLNREYYDFFLSGFGEKTVKIWYIVDNYFVVNYLFSLNSVISSVIYFNKYIVCGTQNNEIIIYKENALNVLSGHTNCVVSLLDLEDKHLASLELDGSTVYVWDVKNCAYHGEYKCHLKTVNCIIKIKNNSIASASDDCTIRIWCYKSFITNFIINHSKPILKIDNLSDDKLISFTFDNELNIWSIERHDLILEGHLGKVNYLIELSNGYFTSSSCDGSLIIWKRPHCPDSREPKKSPEYERFFSIKYDGILSLLYFENDCFASFSNDTYLRIWKLNKLEKKIKLIKKKDFIHLKYLTMITLTTDEIAYSSNENEIKIFNLTTQKKSIILTNHTDWITCISKFENGDTFASGSLDRSIQIWRRSIIYPNLFDTKHTLNHEFAVNCLKFKCFNNFKLLIVGLGNGNIKIWNVTLPEKIVLYCNLVDGHQDIVTHLVTQSVQMTGHISKWLVSGSNDKLIVFWDLGSFSIIKKIQTNYIIMSLSFLNYSELAFGTNYLIKIMNLASGTSSGETSDGTIGKCGCCVNCCDSHSRLQQITGTEDDDDSGSDDDTGDDNGEDNDTSYDSGDDSDTDDPFAY